MLTQFRFENFKSWRDTGEIRMAPLTSIFGTNSSGKTAILQFLLMLKQTVESNDRQLILNLGNERTYVNLGTSFDIIYRHKLPSKIKFSASWIPNHKSQKPLRVPVKIRRFLPVFEYYSSTLKFDSTIAFNVNEIVVEEFYYYFEDNSNKLNNLGIKLINSVDDQFRYKGITEGNIVNFFEFEEREIILPIKNYGFPSNYDIDYFDSDVDRNASLTQGLVLAFEELFNQIYYLGPLRDYPQRFYLWSGELPQDVGKRGEFMTSALLSSHKKGSNVEKKVAFWLKNLGLIHDFQVKPISENRREYEIKVRRFPDSPEVLITDVGFGISQILPVLVLCYYVPEGSTIIFEQPEIHLHPSVQAGLADVFIDVIKTRNVQIILESHSEHLLRRLQRRIAEEHKDMKSEDAALYFCNIDDTGTSKLTELELDTYGNINNWPQSFFGDEMGDLVAMTEAAMRRQTAKN
jgi:AAA15 family ATPase/GTPase